MAGSRPEVRTAASMSASVVARFLTETIRGLLLRTPGGVPLGSALAWCGGILAVSVAVSAWLFRRRTA